MKVLLRIHYTRKDLFVLLLCCLASEIYGSRDRRNDDKKAAANISLIQIHEYMHCQPGWFEYGNKCYKASETEKSWHDALKHCSDYGGNLASVHSKMEQDFLIVYLLLNTKENLWIGLHDQGSESNYVWSDSSEYSYSNWDFLEPSDNMQSSYYRREDCVEMRYSNYKTRIGTWNDVGCDYKRRFICEKDIDGQNVTTKNPLHCGKKDGLKFQNSCFYYISDPKSWNEAEEYCVKRYQGHLVRVKNDAIAAFIQYAGHFLHYHDIWIGIKLRSGWQQVWSSGWFVNDDHSKLFEDINFTGNDCILCDRSRKWEIVPCREKHSFICEQSSAVPPSMEPFSKEFVCPKERKFWRDLGGKFCYYINPDSALTWYEANFECKRRGGALASFHSKVELDVLHQLLEDTEPYISIGLYRKFPKESKTFAWADGSPVDFTAWAENEPSTLSEMCTEVLTKNMLWNDIPCDKKIGYICSIKKIPRAMRDGHQICESMEVNEDMVSKEATCPSQGYEWLNIPGPYCYAMMTMSKKTAYQAHFDCMSRGGTLAIIPSQKELDSLKTLMRSNTDYYIGLYRRSHDNEFVWEDGAIPNFTAWDEGEPNNKDTEICTEMLPKMTWNDINCNAKNYFICSAKKTLNGVAPKTAKEKCHDRFAEQLISKKQSMCSGYCQRVLAVVFGSLMGIVVLGALVFFVLRFWHSDSRYKILQRLSSLNSWQSLSKKEEKDSEMLSLNP